MPNTQQPWDSKKQQKSLESESPYHAENDWNEKVRGFLGMSEKKSAPAASPSASPRSALSKKIYDSSQ